MDFVVHPEKESQSARDEDEEEVVYVVVGEKTSAPPPLLLARLSVSLLFPSLALVNKPTTENWLATFSLSPSILLGGSSATMNISISKGSGLRQ